MQSHYPQQGQSKFWRNTIGTVCLVFSFAPLVLPSLAQTNGSGPVSVRDKGAKCDGAHDDAAAFQTAINAADPAQGGSGKVVIPPSPQPCLLGSALSLRSGEEISATPGSVTIMPIAPYPLPSHNPLLMSVNGVSRVTFRGLTIDGAMDTVGSSSSLFVVYSSDHVVFDSVHVRNSRGSAITFSGGPKGVTYSSIENSSFDNIGTYYLRSGDTAQDRKQSVAWCCGVQDAKGNFVNQHNAVRSSEFGQNGFDNLSVAQQSWFSVSNNEFKGSSNGANVYCSHNAHLRISDNRSHGASGNGIDCFTNTDLFINENESSGNGAAGVQAADTHCGTITHNTTMNNFQSVNRSWMDKHPGSAPSVHRGGITVGGEKPDSYGTEDLLITDNTSGDTQTKPTQAFGIEVRQPANVHNLIVPPTNQLSGNTQGPYGEQLKGPTTPGTLACLAWDGKD
jgi:hypothetical protein